VPPQTVHDHAETASTIRLIWASTIAEIRTLLFATLKPQCEQYTCEWTQEYGQSGDPNLDLHELQGLNCGLFWSHGPRAYSGRN